MSFNSSVPGSSPTNGPRVGFRVQGLGVGVLALGLGCRV